MKICLYCTCKGQLEKLLSPEHLQNALGDGISLFKADCLCKKDSCATLCASLAGQISERSVITVAACSSLARGTDALKFAACSFSGSKAALADIREGCIWQQNTPSARADQAAVAIRTAFARLEKKMPAYPSTAPLPKRVLVIGGGPAGMAAASSLAAFGADVTLAERRPVPGGMLNQLGTLFPAMQDATALKSSLPLQRVRQMMSTEVLSLARSGCLYEAVMKTGGKTFSENFASVIIAVGGMPVLPGNSLRTGELKGVISQMELDTLLTSVEQGKKDPGILPKHAVFVQCVHARNDEEPYCSAICCPTAVKNALRLKQLVHGAAVTVLNRQMVMPGIALEKLYRKAMQSGVRFLHIDHAENLRIEGSENVEAVIVAARPGFTEERIEADRIVCSTPIRPAAPAAKFAAQLGMRMESMGFLRGHEPAHPLESDAEGVFICGSVRWPAYVAQAAEQGKAAAVMAMRYMNEGRMPMAEICGQGPAASIMTSLCSGCGRCVAACPHGACRIDSKGISHVEQQMCRRCGACAAVCPCSAAVLASAPAPRELLALCGGTPRITRRII